MAWIWLFVAGLCEVAWAAGLKRYGFTFRTPGGLATLAGMLMSFVLLSQAMRSLPLSTSYAVWTGIGAAGTVLFGVTVLREPSDWRTLACVALIVSGIVGLKLLTPAQANRASDRKATGEPSVSAAAGGSPPKATLPDPGLATSRSRP